MNPLNPKKLLIVDDEPGVREGLAFVGELADMHVVEAGNGKQAVEILSKPGHGIGVILSDRVMPEMNGSEFLKWLNQSGMHIPFIFITGLPSTDFTVNAFQLGTFDCLEKPFRIQHVSKVIDSSQKYQREFERLSELHPEEASFMTALKVELFMNGSDAYHVSKKDVIVELLSCFQNTIKNMRTPSEEQYDLASMFRGVHHMYSFYHQFTMNGWPLGEFILENLAHLRVHQQVGDRVQQSLLEAITLAERWIHESKTMEDDIHTFLRQFAA